MLARHVTRSASLGWNDSFLSEGELARLGFAKCGRDVLVHPSCVLLDPSRISLGDHVRIDPFCVLTAASIEIGSRVHIGTHCSVSGAGTVIFEDFSCLSHGVKLFSTRDDFGGAALTNSTVPVAFRNPATGDVRIGRHVVVGAGSVIMPAVTIGEGCAVGALSFVGASLDPWGIYAGAPARRVKERKKDLLALEAQLEGKSSTGG